jgi:hypothetical protein
VDAWFHVGVVLRAQNQSGEAVEPLRLAAESGLGEAQSLLGSMYANGSGVERNMGLAMLWWFRSSHTSISDEVMQMTRGQLSSLRQALHRHLLSPNDRQDVLTGFDLIREDLHRQVPLQPLAGLGGNGRIAWEHVTPTEPVLAWVIEHALALDQSAQRKLHAWYVDGEAGRLMPGHPRIRQYFLQTAKEDNPFSCQVLDAFATDFSDGDISDWQLAFKECSDKPMKSGMLNR